MAWQHTIYAYPIVFATALSLLFVAHAVRYGRRYGRSPTLVTFASMNVAVAVWTGFSAIKLLSTDPSVKFLAYKLLYVGSELVTPLLVLFALAYTGRTQWVRRRVVVGLFVVPVAYLLLLFTNPYDLVIVESRLLEVGGLVVWRAETGPAYVALSFVYVVTLGLTALGIVGYEAVRLGRPYVPQAVLLTVAIVTPMVASLLTSAGVPPFGHDGVNLVPATAAVSMTAVGAATFRYRLLDLPHIAYTTVVEQSPDGVLVLDSTRRIVHANETASSLLGRGAVVGDRLDAVLPEASPATDEPGDLPTDVTVDVTAVASPVEYLDVRSRPLRQHGDVVGWVLVLRDVTEQRRRQRELEAFTSVVSHDLREPVRTTEGYLELLEDRYGPDIDDDGRELLSVARENSQRMQAMIADLLRYSRIDTTELEFESVDCERLVSEVLETLRFEIEDHDATVVVDELPTVRGVEHLLRRVFQNLIVNALKHADTSSPEIHLSATRRHDGWDFSIRDDGVGIEPAERERVFDLFARGTGSSGTGMGLAICKKIVEVHGGWIDLDSAPGGGTEVTFTIPGNDSTPQERPLDRVS